MKKIITALFSLSITLSVFSQTISYAGSGLSTSSCNVFDPATSVSGYTHYAIMGGVGYDGSEILLPLQESSGNGFGVVYGINIPLQVGKSYNISFSAAAPSGAPSTQAIYFCASQNLLGSSTNCTLQSAYDIWDLFHQKPVFSATPITSSTFQTYTVVTNYWPIPGLNYINLASHPDFTLTDYLSSIKIQSVTLTATAPATAPKISGNNCVYFSVTAGTSHNGSITGTGGATATFSVNASGPPPGDYTTTFNISGATFTDGTTSFTVTNGADYRQVVIPAGGSFSYTSTFSEPNSFGSGTICVQ